MHSNVGSKCYEILEMVGCCEWEHMVKRDENFVGCVQVSLLLRAWLKRGEVSWGE